MWTALLLAALLQEDAGKAYLERVASTPWSDPIECDGVRAQVRKAELFGLGFLEAAAGAGVRDVARFTLPKAGWFFNAPVTSGTYRLRFARSTRNLRVVLEDAEGREVRTLGFAVDGPISAIPSVQLSRDHGSLWVVLECGAVRLRWRYVPQEAVAALARGGEVVRGRVILAGDLPRNVLEALAAEGEASIAVHAGVLGREEPAGPFYVQLFTKPEEYAAADRLLTGGRCAGSAGFTCGLTGRCFLRYFPHAGKEAFRDFQVPLQTRSLVLHELHHAVARVVRPTSETWPEWLSEGMAGIGVYHALSARSRADAEMLHDHFRGWWWFHERVLPNDLLLAKMPEDDSLRAYYAAAYLMLREMAARPKELSALLGRVDEEEIVLRSADAAREELETRWGTSRLWKQISDRAAEGPGPPVVVWGQMDRVDGALRVITEPGSTGTSCVVFLDRTYGPSLEFDASFRVEPVGSRQAEVYIAFTAGRRSMQFLKVVVTPWGVALFRQAMDKPERWGMRRYATGLDGEGWHRIRVVLDATKRVVSVEVGGRREEFTLLRFVPSEATRIGVGAYDGIVWWKDVRAK